MSAADCRPNRVLRVCAVIVSVAGAIATAPAPAAGAGFGPVGSTRYVRLVHRDGELSVVLTPRGRRHFRAALRGVQITATCTHLRLTAFGVVSEGQSASGSTSARGGFVPVIDRGSDFCDIGRARVRRNRRGTSVTDIPGMPVDSIALTRRGAEYLSEDGDALRLLEILDFARLFAGQTAPRDRFPTGERLASSLRHTVMALPNAGATPSGGRVGYWSDGAAHAETVIRAADGRRLFIDENATVLSTNVGDHLLRAASGQVARTTTAGRFFGP